jgi:glycosyltransferase involved in cell wall biosynthesis
MDKRDLPVSRVVSRLRGPFGSRCRAGRDGCGMKPLFSVAIPTRNRPNTLFFSIKSVLESTESNFEVVVSDNGDNDLSRKVVDRFPRDRIRYVRAPRPLSMTDNWSLALENCRGEYVTVIGDDDALMPRSLANARILIENTGMNVVSWTPHTYWWSDTIAYWNSNVLYVSGYKEIKKVRTRDILQRHFLNPTSFSDLPQIYNSFVAKRVIEQAINRWKSYFPIENCPDIVSGYVNLLTEEKILLTEIPLSVRGNSGASNGTASWYRKGGKEIARENIEFEIAHGDKSKPGTITGEFYEVTGLTLGMANLKAVAFGTFSADLKGVRLFGPDAVVRALIANCLSEPESYHEIVAEARTLCARHGLDFASFKFPPKPRVLPRRRNPNLWNAQAKRISVSVDCDLAQVYDVCAAARLADALMPDITG